MPSRRVCRYSRASRSARVPGPRPSSRSEDRKRTGASSVPRVMYVRAAFSTGAGSAGDWATATAATATAATATATTAAVNTMPDRPRTANTSAPTGSAPLRANHHAPGTVADRHLADHGERVGIDDRHIPRGAVGGDEAGAVLAHGQPPGPCAHGHLADQRAVARRDHRHGTAAPRAHVQPPVCRIERDTHGARLLAQLHELRCRRAARK